MGIRTAILIRWHLYQARKTYARIDRMAADYDCGTAMINIISGGCMNAYYADLQRRIDALKKLGYQGAKEPAPDAKIP